MILRVSANNVSISVNVENVMFARVDDKKHVFEVSCVNLDAYRFTIVNSSPKNIKKFQEACEMVMDAMREGREYFFCSLVDFNVKFEKSGRCSYFG